MTAPLSGERATTPPQDPRIAHAYQNGADNAKRHWEGEAERLRAQLAASEARVASLTAALAKEWGYHIVPDGVRPAAASFVTASEFYAHVAARDSTGGTP